MVLGRQGVGNGTKSIKRNELGRKNKTEAKRLVEGKTKGKYRKCQGGRDAQKSVQHSKHPSPNLGTKSRGPPTLWQKCPPLLF